MQLTTTHPTLQPDSLTSAVRTFPCNFHSTITTNYLLLYSDSGIFGLRPTKKLASFEKLTVVKKLLSWNTEQPHCPINSNSLLTVLKQNLERPFVESKKQCETRIIAAGGPYDTQYS